MQATFLRSFFPGILLEPPVVSHEAPCPQVFDLSSSFSIDNFLCLSLSTASKIRTLHANKVCLIIRLAAKVSLGVFDDLQQLSLAGKVST